jgi:hypothetical protein
LAGASRRPPGGSRPGADPTPGTRLKPGAGEDPISTPTSTEGPVFKLSDGQQTLTVTGRQAAVAQAKALSVESRRPVSVESEDGRVSMQFVNGGLLSYHQETDES